MTLLIAQSAPSVSCATQNCFSILKAADEFTKLTGSLAAFTFAALTFLVGRTTERSRLEDTIVMFVAAFVSLVVTSFLYERLVAEELAQGRAEALYFFGSLAFVLAVLQLFLGLTRLLMRLDFKISAKFMRGVSVVFIPLVAFVFLAVTAVDAYGFQKTERAAWFHTKLGPEVLGAFAALLVLVGWRSWRSLSPIKTLPGHDARVVRCAWSSVFILGVITTAAAVMSELGHATTLPEPVYMAGVAVAWVTVSVYCCLMSAGGLAAATETAAVPVSIAAQTAP